QARTAAGRAPRPGAARDPTVRQRRRLRAPRGARHPLTRLAGVLLSGQAGWDDPSMSTTEPSAAVDTELSDAVVAYLRGPVRAGANLEVLAAHAVRRTPEELLAE